MSRLSDLESGLVGRLSQAMISGAPAFEAVRGVSGGNRPGIRAALRRERMPAAYIGFVEEPTAPEVREQVRGAKVTVLLAARALRTTSDPRNEDVDSVGAFALLDVARSQLDAYEPSPGLRLVNLTEKFVEADDRVAIYELLYRVWPVVGEDPLLFLDGDPLAGNDRRLEMEVGPIELEFEVFSFPGLAGVSRQVTGVAARPIVWRGQLRSADPTTLSTIESDLEARVGAQVSGTITDGNARVFANCVLDRYVRRGGRRTVDGMIVQEAELHFSQLTPFI